MLVQKNVFISILLAGLLGLICGSIANGWSIGDDINPSSLPAGFDWDDITTDYTYWYVDSSDYPKKFKPKGISASSLLIDSHVKTSAGNKITHNHKQYDFGDSSSDPNFYIPSVTKSNKYWNERFWKGTKCTYVSGSTNKTNGLAWAFDDAGTGGSYNYWFSDSTTAYNDECSDVTPHSDVSSNDLLKYSSRTAKVTSVADGKPSGLKWKYGSSGVYSYSPVSGHKWDLPKCTGSIDESKVIDNQGWTWSESGAGDDGDPYRVD